MNYKQLKLFAIGSMVFDHVVRIFPLYYMLLPLALPFWDAGQDDVAVWLTEDLRHYLMYIGRLVAPILSTASQRALPIRPISGAISGEFSAPLLSHKSRIHYSI